MSFYIKLLRFETFIKLYINKIYYFAYLKYYIDK
jgi:hypothetical protein